MATSNETAHSARTGMAAKPTMSDTQEGPIGQQPLPLSAFEQSEGSSHPPRPSDSADTAQLESIKETIREAVGDTGAKQAWTFSSSGWLFVYFFGVIKALHDLDRHKDVYVVGSSGGSCAGAFAFLHDADTLDAVVEYVKGCAKVARSGSIRDVLNIRDYVQGAIRRFMSDGAARAVSGNMEVSVSKLQNPLTHWPPWPLKNVRVKAFADEQALEDAVLASACVWPFPPVKVQGVGWCIDGVYSDSELVSSIVFGRPFFTFHRMEAAVSVCPFYCSRADIVPSEYVPPHWAAYPPDSKSLDWLYHLGYKDCLAWLMVKEHSEYGLPAWARRDTGVGQAQKPESVDSDNSETCMASTDAVSERIQEACKSVSKRVARALENMRDAGTSFSASISEAAQSAVGCDAAAEEVMTGTVTKFRQGVSLIAWVLIITEMFLQSCLAATVATWAPLLPAVSTKMAWSRFTKVTKVMATPKLLLKALPALGPHIDLEANKNKDFAKALREHSILYRVLYYLLY